MHEQRDRLGRSRRDGGNCLGIHRDIVGQSLDPDICDRVRPAVPHRGAIPRDGVPAQHAGDEFQSRDRKIVGTAAHRNDGRRGAPVQIFEGVTQPRGPLLPVPRLHVGHDVDFLLRGIDRLGQLLQLLRNAAEVKRLGRRLLGMEQLVEAQGIESDVARDHPVLGAEENQADRVTRVNALRDHPDFLERLLEAGG